MKFFARLILMLFVMTLATIGYAGFQSYNGTTALGLFDKVKCSTGLTCTRTGQGVLTIVSSPVTTEVGGFTIKATDTNNATLTLQADNSDDNGDDWALKALASDNSLAFQNDTTGSLATKFSISKTGVLTLANNETISNATDDTVRVASEDASTVLEVYSPDTGNGDASLLLTADAAGDNGDKWLIKHTGSGNTLNFQNNTSGSFVDKFIVSTAGNLTVKGTVTGDGTKAMSGFLEPLVAATATTITAAQCGSVFYNSGAVQMELPEASTVLGCKLTFVTLNASNFDINPDDADQIVILTNAAGDAIRNATVGDTVTIMAVSASQWVVLGSTGTWSDIN